MRFVRDGAQAGLLQAIGKIIGAALLLGGALSLQVEEIWARPAFSAIAVDARTGKVLFARDPDGLRHPASITKVMTLYILFQELKKGTVSLDTRFKVSEHASTRAPSKLGLRPGQTISVDDAIRAIVTLSANDVASVIAENLGASEEAFAAKMTRTARGLGMSRTSFYNASGLPDPRQITTARDIATLSLRVQRDFPEYYPYFRLMAFKYGNRVIKTHNRLLGRYPGTDGIKTGYTQASGFNLTSSVARGDKRIVGVVLGATSGSSRNAYMMSMFDKTLPKCRDGKAIVAAVEGVSPKPDAAATDVADNEPVAQPEQKPEQKPQSKAKKVAAASAKKTTKKAAGKKAVEPEPVVTEASVGDDEDVAESADENNQSGGKTLETAMSEVSNADEPAVSQDQPAAATAAEPSVADQIRAAKQTLIAKTSPDGSALPFAVKKAGDNAAGIVLVPPADPSWNIQIGAYPSKKDAQAVLYKVKGLALDLLQDKQALTVEILKGSDTVYRARFSGFNEDNARAACRTLISRGFGCVALEPQS